MTRSHELSFFYKKKHTLVLIKFLPIKKRTKAKSILLSTNYFAKARNQTKKPVKASKSTVFLLNE
jgi:hypothetical protein